MCAARTFLAIFTLSVAGCGTLTDMVAGPLDDKVFYRGVRADIETVKTGEPRLVFIGAADLPFSTLADTVMAPLLIPVWLNPRETNYLRVEDTAKRDANARTSEQESTATPTGNTLPGTAGQTGHREIATEVGGDH
jgi:uncharacterized protein YceK